MASKRNTPDQLRADIMNLLEDYVEDVEGATQKAIDATARQTVKQLKNYRPSGAEQYGSWSKYLSGWTSSQDHIGRYTYKRIVHNKGKYMLAHLLEKGHKNANGQQHAKAYPHISIAEDKAKTIIEKELEKEINKL